MNFEVLVLHEWLMNMEAQTLAKYETSVCGQCIDVKEIGNAGQG